MTAAHLYLTLRSQFFTIWYKLYIQFYKQNDSNLYKLSKPNDELKRQLNCFGGIAIFATSYRLHVGMNICRLSHKYKSTNTNI